ncbi:MAG: prephenate dehydrogenase/arogenate dehydrogenase family protein [Actinobacteria bacterium]|uniref:Prephenate dehydrogenase n=1 Tax=freshwater metagenome TaxID=449393 RepID=A0A6J7D944_9ZZZZ|nr:prephenate dehydrogenase/arogenate dehydrogenase family protein [Actinomycetota bacterium]
MRLAIIGTGLIGTSVAMAAARIEGVELVGWDIDPAELKIASERSGLAEADSLGSAVSDADAVLVAVPVGVSQEVVNAVLEHAGPDALITDAGSTKRAVVEQTGDVRFVGGHPLAGGEVGGAASARADLFKGATWFLTPVDSTAGVQLERAFRLVSDLGAKPRAVAPDVHDRILATVSHLPHVLANILVSEAAGTVSDEDESLPATGPSFRDATRVAGAPSSIWTDIYISNAEALIERLASVEAELANVRGMLERRDGPALTAWNDAAGAQKLRLAGGGGIGRSVHQIRVQVPNRPGVLAEIALSLGQAGIDLADLQLHPADDRATGTIVLGIEGGENVERAETLISGLGHKVSEEQ